MEDWGALLDAAIVAAPDHPAVDDESRPDGDPALGETRSSLLHGGDETCFHAENLKGRFSERAFRGMAKQPICSFMGQLGRNNTMTISREGPTRRALASALVVALLATVFALFLPTANALAMTPDTGFEACLRDKHNAERTARGLQPLQTRSDLVSYARNHSAWMIDTATFKHSTNLGSASTGWTKLGENIGRGAGCAGLHKAFMNSAGHRDNILDPAYTAIGVGGGVDADGRYWVTVVFGAYKNQTPPTTAAPAPTTTTTAPAPAPTTAPKPKPAPTTTTTVPPTTTTTAGFEVPEVPWEMIVTELIKIALSRSLPVNLG